MKKLLAMQLCIIMTMTACTVEYPRGLSKRDKNGYLITQASTPTLPEPEELSETEWKSFALNNYPTNEACEELLEVEYDDMTDRTSLRVRDTNLGQVQSYLAIWELKKELHEGYRDTRSLSWSVAGEDGCIDEHSSILVLFEDGTRMERKNERGFSCSSGLVSTEFRKIQPHNSRYFKDNFIFSGEEANRTQEYKDSKLRQYDALMKDMWIRNKAENEEKEQEWVKLATSKVSKIRVTGASTRTDTELTEEQASQLMTTFACFHKEFYN